MMGAAIRKLRGRRQPSLSLRGLGRLAHIPPGTLSSSERDLRSFNERELQKVAQVFEVSMGDLIGWATVETQYPAKGCACQHKEVP